MKRLFFISCMLILSMSFAKKWDATYISKLIAGGGIDKVIEYYKGKYYSDNRDPQDAFKIAELYVKKKEYATAMEWYDKERELINTSKVNLFNYASTNHLMGEYQKALDGYLMYAALTGDVSKVMDLANQCEKILKSSALAYNYKLENYTYNTSADETNIALLRTNPVYVMVKNGKEGQASYDVYQIVRAFENFDEPLRAYNKGIPKLIVTSVSFSQDGNSVVFSAIDEKTDPKKGIQKNEKIFTADNLGGKFLNVKPFPFNTEGYSLKNPSYNTDGTVICFSSNQPGGSGGFDIWESVKVKDKWTTPTNLGKLLNTMADELHPFIVQDGKNNTLYFSSNREGGFGGYDIFTAQKSNNTWQDVTMQSAPLNSAGDDISVVYDDETKTGYLSSNRTGGKGGLDVYRFIPFNLKLMVYVNDTFSEKPVDYALVQVFEEGEKLFEGVTDLTAKAVFQINKNKTYTLKISKDGYRTLTQKISSAGKMSGDSVVENILLKPDVQFSAAKGSTNSLSLDNYIIFTGKVTDAASNKPAVKAKMRMVNYTTQKLREVDIDAGGEFEIKLLLNNNYKVIFETENDKITDELTTYGLEKNSVKVRDYLLTGNKFKLTENKVYQPGTLPSDRTLNVEKKNNNPINSIANSHEPITQQKIDSLLKVISADNPKTAKPTQPLNQPKVSVSAQVVKKEVPEKVLSESKIKTTDNIVEQKPAGTVAATAVKMEEPVVAKKTAPIEEPKAPVAEVKNESAAAIPETVKNTDEVPQFAADMVSTKKVKKVKGTSQEKDAKKIETIVVQPANNTPSVNQEKVTDIPAKKSVPEVKTEKNTTPVREVIKEEVKVTVKESSKSESPVINPIAEKQTNRTPVAAEKKPSPVTENALPDLYYKIQLASYDAGNISFPEFAALGKIEEVKAYERYIYRLGNFDNLERAKEVLELVRSQGYFVAFILQYSKGKVTGIVK